MKLYIQHNYGLGCAVGVAASKELIERQCNHFYNHKVTNMNPIWLSDSFAYIITTEALLLAGLVSGALVSLQGTRAARRVIRKGRRISKLPLLAMKKAKRQLKTNFIPENFLNPLEFECP